MFVFVECYVNTETEFDVKCQWTYSMSSLYPMKGGQWQAAIYQVGDITTIPMRCMIIIRHMRHRPPRTHLYRFIQLPSQAAT